MAMASLLLFFSSLSVEHSAYAQSPCTTGNCSGQLPPPCTTGSCSGQLPPSPCPFGNCGMNQPPAPIYPPAGGVGFPVNPNPGGTGCGNQKDCKQNDEQGNFDWCCPPDYTCGTIKPGPVSCIPPTPTPIPPIQCGGGLKSCIDENDQNNSWCCATNEMCGSFAGPRCIQPSPTPIPPVECGSGLKSCEAAEGSWCCPTNEECGTFAGPLCIQPSPTPLPPMECNEPTPQSCESNGSSWCCGADQECAPSLVEGEPSCLEGLPENCDEGVAYCITSGEIFPLDELECLPECIRCAICLPDF